MPINVEIVLGETYSFRPVVLGLDLSCCPCSNTDRGRERVRVSVRIRVRDRGRGRGRVSSWTSFWPRRP